MLPRPRPCGLARRACSDRIELFRRVVAVLQRLNRDTLPTGARPTSVGCRRYRALRRAAAHFRCCGNPAKSVRRLCKPPGGLSEPAPLSTCFTAAATFSVEPPGSRRTPAPACLAAHVQVLVHVAGEPVPLAANACCVCRAAAVAEHHGGGSRFCPAGSPRRRRWPASFFRWFRPAVPRSIVT